MISMDGNRTVLCLLLTLLLPRFSFRAVVVDRVTGSHAPQTRPELGKKTKERCKLGGGRFKMQGNLLTRLVLGGLRCLSFKVYPTHIP